MSATSFGLKKPNGSSSGGALNGGPAPSQQSNKSIIEIYTDWANHYLDKIHGGRKRVKDLQSELQDGLILAEVVEAVMGSKVPDINRKPKNNGHMLDNIQHCLKFLNAKGVNVSDVKAKDVWEGNLKAILGLFFQLSRFKQQQKMLAQERSGTPKIPSVPPSPARSSSSAIPSPMKTTKKSFLPMSSQNKSMLEKLRSTTPSQLQQPAPLREVRKGLGKRTSSSSGFSSARSIGSESSVSLSSDTNFPSPSALRRINENAVSNCGAANTSPKQGRKIIPRLASPKRSPKLQRSGTEIKDYGLIDQHYPPHHASNLSSRIPNRTAAQHNGSIVGPGAASASGRTSRIPKQETANGGVPQGCAVRPYEAGKEAPSTSATSENDESTAQMTASFHSRTKSLPRTKRREDGSPGPANVAVVSPMPAKNEAAASSASAAASTSEEVNNAERSTKPESSHKKDDSLVNEDPLKGLVPLGPLGLFSNASRQPTCGKPTHQLPFSSKIDQFSSALSNGSGGGTTIAANATTLFQQQGTVDGYMSDSDAFQLKCKSPTGYASANSPPSQSSIDDGYLSEGGASFYAKRIQNRIALEKQKEVEEQNRKLDQRSRPLPGLPDFLGSQPSAQASPETAPSKMNSNASQIYRVVGGRKHVQKSEAGMQTEVGNGGGGSIKQPVQEHYDWKQAMAYNAKILSSQEKAMDEYLRRQRAASDFNQMYHHQPRSSKEDGRAIVRLQEPFKMPLTGMGPRHVPSSTPATPTGRRRNNNGGSASRNGSPHSGQLNVQHNGGSLERKQMKIKISGGTQTAQPPNNYVSDSEYGHYMGSPGSNRKVYNQPPPSNSKSLPKGASSLNYGLMMEKIQQKRQQRQYSPKINDGSLSDSNYYDLGNRSSSPYSWLQPASAYAAANMGLQGNNSHESNGRPALIPEDLSVCSTVASDILGSNESLNSVSSSIQQARANSLTKARLLLHQQQISRSASTGNAQITSTRSNVSERSYSSLSTNRTNNGTTGESDYYGVPSFNLRNRNMENCYGSIGGGATEQEKTEAAIIKLRKELAEEHDKVLNLTSQLATNAHVVAAFEQSLANMTSRLAHLTATAEKKDHELNELRRKIELFKQCGVDAGLIPQDSDRSQQQFGDQSDSECDSPVAKNGKPKRSGWLRNSFSKAFNKNSSGKKASLGSVSDAEPESPKHKPSRASSALSGQIDSMIPVSPIKSSKSSDTIDGNANPSSELINELKRQLVEKENLLTETRLEALSSAHQLESLRDTVTKMRTELMSVKSENEKLHTIVQNHKSLNSSQNSLNNNENDDRARRHSSTLSESSILSGPSSLDLSATTDPTNREGGKLVPVVVLNTDKSFTRIGTISVSGRSNWELLDSLVHRLFKEYVMRVDPTSNLGLNAESIGYYQAGEIKRTSMAARKPELLPYGYLVGDATDIVVSLKKSPDGNSNNLLVDALAFETLTPKSIIQRYVALLLESKRIVLSGPCGSGKTFIALKIANFIVNKSKKSIANFCVQRNNVPELKDFLKRLTDEDQSEDKQDMNVVILDNLHHAGRLDDVFQECQLPRNCYIIGTMVGQGAQTPTNLQLQHNFRVIQLTPHAEPLRGLVGRCLRQRLLSIEAKTRMLDGEMSAAVDWVAKIHLHLNKILEAHASGDILLSPVLFMDCPIGHEEGPEAQGDQVRRWFLHLWNDTLHPRISEAIKEGIQLYGHRVQWEDPIKYLEDTWPWANSAPLEMERILPEDVGYDLKKSSDLQCRLPRPSSTGTSLSSGSGTNTESDPLFNMLLHLQEAAAANNDTAITN